MSLRGRLLVILLAALAVLLLLVFSRHRLTDRGLSAAFDAEFYTRPDGYPGLREWYGLRFPSAPLQMDPGLMYLAVAEGAVDVIDGFATDGRIPAFDLVSLEDDRQFFPPYHAAPLVRSAALAAHPGLSETLNLLAGRVGDRTMQRLNLRVDEGEATARRVAREFLADQGLLAEPSPRSQGASALTVGSKHFTEQEILGELLALLVETRLGLPVERRLNMGGTMICFNALRAGDIDLYVEYTGTGLVNILQQPSRSDPERVLATVRQEFRARFGLVWLEPLGLNSTYTLVMRRQRARELGLRTLSDLARHIAGEDRR